MSKNIKQRKQQRKNRSCVWLVSVILVVVLLFAYYAVAHSGGTINNIFQATTTAYDDGDSSSSREGTIVDNNNNDDNNDVADNDVADNDGDDESAWCLTLVNRWYPLSVDTAITTTKLSNGECVDTRIYPYLQKMFDAARASGVYPIVASGYRTTEEQQAIYDEKVEEYKAQGLSTAEAKKETEYWVAIPGTSEHQLGLAVDINADGVNSNGTEVYEWLQKNAHLYGFIYRYPADKVDITGVANEPWHYRYVGVKAATEIYNQDICLEEYLGKVN